jgi:hypothetical protein
MTGTTLTSVMQVQMVIAHEQPVADIVHVKAQQCKLVEGTFRPYRVPAAVSVPVEFEIHHAPIPDARARR